MHDSSTPAAPGFILMEILHGDWTPLRENHPRRNRNVAPGAGTAALLLVAPRPFDRLRVALSMVERP